MEEKRRRHFERIGIVLGVLLGAGVLALEVAGSRPLGSPGICLAVLGTTVVLGALLPLPALLRTRRFFPVRRLDAVRSRTVLQHLLTQALVAALFFQGGAWTWSDLGFKEEVPAVAAFAAGVAAYLGFMLAAGALSTWWPGRLEATKSFVQAMMAFFPREGRTRVRVWVILLVNPFVEEIVWRGFLVHMLGEVTGQQVLAMVLGLVLVIGGHLYQGFRQIPWHVLFYAFAVVLLYSPLGMWGCLGLHFAGDVVPMLLFPSRFARLRRLRAARFLAPGSIPRGKH